MTGNLLEAVSIDLYFDFRQELKSMCAAISPRHHTDDASLAPRADMLAVKDQCLNEKYWPLSGRSAVSIGYPPRFMKNL